MIELNQNSKIYLTCPANYFTGGPECLHQLCLALNQNGFDACMYYLSSKDENPVHPNFKKYNLKYVLSIEDNINNVIIVPETHTHI
ncbi:MAG: hypothetical protein EOO43_02520, partial [Flavobacterium sp.]